MSLHHVFVDFKFEFNILFCINQTINLFQIYRVCVETNLLSVLLCTVIYNEFLQILGLLDYQATKSLLLPRIKRVCVETNLLSVRVNGLVCIGKLLTHMDKWLVLDEILPMLQQVPSREPAVIMAIVGMLIIENE